MKTQIFSVLDMVAGLYVEPFFAPSIEYALRSFKDAAMDEAHQFFKHPADYALYHIGEFDVDKGILTPLDPRKLGTASSFAQLALTEEEA